MKHDPETGVTLVETPEDLIEFVNSLPPLPERTPEELPTMLPAENSTVWTIRAGDSLPTCPCGCGSIVGNSWPPGCGPYVD